MKKSLVALAALAAATGAFAQSSVTMFGIVDATFQYGKSDTNKVNALGNSGLNSSRFGVRGVEDLGGGMNGSFHLEAGLNNDDGQGAATNSNNQAVGAFNTTTGANAPVRAGSQGLTFNRRSTVSLGGGFGEVRLGRDYTPHFWNHTVYDPFGTNGVGTTQTLNSSLGGITTVRASNSIGYFLPGNLGGAFGQIQYYMGENVSTTPGSAATTTPVAAAVAPAANPGKNNGNGFSARGGYANGPISAAVAFGRTNAKTAAGVKNDITTVNVGGSYDLGVVKLSGLYDQDKVTNGNKGRGFLFGANAPLGAGEIRASYSTYQVTPVAVAGVTAAKPQTNKFAVGYIYNLSKRTAVYGTFATLKNKNGAQQALNGSSQSATAGTTATKSSGFDVGVRHSF